MYLLTKRYVSHFRFLENEQVPVFLSFSSLRTNPCSKEGFVFEEISAAVNNIVAKV